MSETSSPAFWRRLDALLLAALLIARVRIDTLAEAAVLPFRQNDVARHPFLGHLLSAEAMKLLAQQQLVDPIGLLLIVLAFGGLALYLAVDEFVAAAAPRYRLKLALLWAIIVLTVFAPSVKLALLRQGSGPASYSHDGGVIQTEATIAYLLQGRNPYREDYLQTPMAEWGISEFRTALYHYPYLPWTFLFSAPFKLAAERILGWYDQRFVYLLLFAGLLLILPGLARSPQSRLLLVMLIGLNPIMGSDLIYGQNDSFVLAWIAASLWLWARGQRPGAGRWWGWGAGAAFGLACASKPTAWFLAPFYLLLAAGDATDLWRRPRLWLRRAAATIWPAAAVALAIIGPYFVWDPAAMIDDVWAWSSGTSATAYQIWGWGASNLLLASGQVTSRFVYWPFWMPQLIIGLPLLVVLLWRQARDNTPARALWGYGLFLLVFFYVSRFMNENYLGYILALLALGALIETAPAAAAQPAGAVPGAGDSGGGAL
ncbi:MAG: glycosyltransferase 87 family protein [Anaerolineae bacterium]